MMKAELRLVPAQGSAWPLHGAANTRAWESRLAATLAPHSLMARAGWAIARCALAVAPHAQTIWVAAGGGNNGGDGLEAACHLHRAGKRVVVSLLGDPAKLPADAANAWAQLQKAGIKLLSNNAQAPAADLVIDALLGIGTQHARVLNPALRQVIQFINAQPAPVLAIDLPSGLNTDTGTVVDDAVRATHTLSLLTLKPGLFTAQGRDHAGTVWFDSLQCDLTELTADAQLLGPNASLPWRAARAHASHKGLFGDVYVIGGAPGMVGAVVLAARASLLGGAGRVFVSPLDESAPAYSLSTPELMFRHTLWQQRDALTHTTVVAGCGGGDAMLPAMPPLLACAPRLVLDADALNAIAEDTALWQQLEQRSRRGLATVLTPHPLEAARLLKLPNAAAVQADRLQHAQALALRLACTVVLKGSGTVIASPGGLVHINPTGNARLASAGTGDVLAGWIAGRWSARSQATSHEVACCAVWEHGAAAMQGSQNLPLPATKLIDALAEL
jgi:ADP-dependent NAD(P)H-hydrate dehydratase / NAD(P)H-hydrate epimerase